jgi:hypothetical protein
LDDYCFQNDNHPESAKREVAMNALDVLKYGHLTVLEAVDELPDDDWETTGVVGFWSVKNIIAHLASFEILLKEVFYSLLEGTEMPTMGRWTADPEQFNTDEVGQRKGMSPGETLEEYQQNYQSARELTKRLPAESYRPVGVLPWYGAEYDLDDFIAYTFYGHKREHSAQVAVFRDQIQR